MKTSTIASLVLIALCVCLAATSSIGTAQSDAPTAANSWEHLAMPLDGGAGLSDPKTGRRINQLGRDGWELVDVETLTNNGTTSKTVYFFKRPL